MTEHWAIQFPPESHFLNGARSAKPTNRNPQTSSYPHCGTKQTVALADEVLGLVKTFAPDLELKYNKFYIGLARDRQPNNFVVFRAKKNSFRAEIRFASSAEIDQQLESAGIDVMDYETKWSRYRLRLTKNDIQKNRDLLLKLLKISYGVDAEASAAAMTAKA